MTPTLNNSQPPDPISVAAEATDIPPDCTPAEWAAWHQLFQECPHGSILRGHLPALEVAVALMVMKKSSAASFTAEHQAQLDDIRVRFGLLPDRIPRAVDQGNPIENRTGSAVMDASMCGDWTT